jgi:hypothetical protein
MSHRALVETKKNRCNSALVERGQTIVRSQTTSNNRQMPIIFIRRIRNERCVCFRWFRHRVWRIRSECSVVLLILCRSTSTPSSPSSPSSTNSTSSTSSTSSTCSTCNASGTTSTNNTSASTSASTTSTRYTHVHFPYTNTGMLIIISENPSNSCGLWTAHAKQRRRLQWHATTGDSFPIMLISNSAHF